jgi:iron complex transport system substrate-binding protein
MSIASRRGRSLATAVLVVAVLAAACGDATSPEASTWWQASDGGFPVTIDHKYGSTAIDAPPERIVTVGLTDHDALLALGVVPVGVTEWFGEHPSATWSWAQDELGDGRSEVVGDSNAINFERIAGLRPDAIVALYAGLAEQEYETLSQIAPTVAQPGEYADYGIPWQELTRAAGRIVGKPERADELVARVEARFAEARAEHPEFEGATGLVATPYAGSVSVFAPEDPRGRFLADLGFVQPARIAELAGDEFSADLSLEQTDLIDVDALVWIVNSVDTDRPRIEAEALYQQLEVAREGRAAFVENLAPLGGALSFVSVLSLPLLLDELIPMLDAAVDGDPATR